MSDIPVGSPPAPPGRHAAPSGWYPDPVSSAQERYWDGWQWSRNTRPIEHPASGGGYGQVSYPPYPNPNVRAANARPPLGYAGPRTASAQATMTADGVPLSSWWWRALAVVIDNVILSVIITIVTFPVWQSLYAAWSSYFNAVLEAQRSGVAPPTMSVTDLISGRNQMILTMATLGIGMLYHVGFLRWKSATPGKLLCGLRVVPVDHGHATGPLPWSSILIRSAIWVLPSINSFLSLITVLDVLFPLWHPKRQALHDLAAKTQVIRPREPDHG
ncbi:MAG TPA: RDD family protein [Propionibacteriaceae bacterium]|nr:RDD family protein [Propionibacteriaceae bacterium]